MYLCVSVFVSVCVACLRFSAGAIVFQMSTRGNEQLAATLIKQVLELPNLKEFLGERPWAELQLEDIGALANSTTRNPRTT